MKLKELRNRAGMTQEQVAVALGMPTKTYQNYEREHRDPDSDVLCALADMYGVTLDELVGRTEEAQGDRREARLLRHYRSMDPVGQDTPLAIAQTLGTMFPRD